jgi:hypothetical protein
MADVPKIDRAFRAKGPKETVLADLTASALPAETKTFIAARIQAQTWAGLSAFYQEHPHPQDDIVNLHLKQLY